MVFLERCEASWIDILRDAEFLHNMDCAHGIVSPMQDGRRKGCGVHAGQAFDVPEETFTAIETLLPTGKGKFLELWAQRGAQRPGWTRVSESPRAK